MVGKKVQMDKNHSYDHLHIIDQIKEKINQGIFQERELLPSEFHLSQQLQTSRYKIRKALEVLIEQNIITNKPGFGFYVNPKPLFFSGIEELNSVTETIKKSGRQPGSQYLSIDVVEPTKEDLENFHPLKLEKLIRIERIRTADNFPVVFNIDKIPNNLIPLEYIDSEQSMFQLMEKYSKKRISHAVAQIEPIGFHERIYDILHYDPDKSLLLLKQMHYTEDDQPVLHSVNYYRPDMFSFHVVRKRI